MRTRKTARKTNTTNTAEVFQSIVTSILQTRKKEFTSTDIAEDADASPRHSRRTLAELASRRVLRVNREAAPYVYTVAQKDALRRLISA